MQIAVMGHVAHDAITTFNCACYYSPLKKKKKKHFTFKVTRDDSTTVTTH